MKWNLQERIRKLLLTQRKNQTLDLYKFYSFLLIKVKICGLKINLNVISMNRFFMHKIFENGLQFENIQNHS